MGSEELPSTLTIPSPHDGHVMVPRIGHEIFEALNKAREVGLKKIL